MRIFCLRVFFKAKNKQLFYTTGAKSRNDLSAYAVCVSLTWRSLCYSIHPSFLPSPPPRPRQWGTVDCGYRNQGPLCCEPRAVKGSPFLARSRLEYSHAWFDNYLEFVPFKMSSFPAYSFFPLSNPLLSFSFR